MPTLVRKSPQEISNFIQQDYSALASKPDDLSSISRTYMVEGENQPLQVVLWLLLEFQNK